MSCQLTNEVFPTIKDDVLVHVLDCWQWKTLQENANDGIGTKWPAAAQVWSASAHVYRRCPAGPPRGRSRARVLHRGEAVRDGDGGPAHARLLEGGLHDALALGVQGACRLVEEEDGRVADEGPADGDSLLLASHTGGPPGRISDRMLGRVRRHWAEVNQRSGPTSPGPTLLAILRRGVAWEGLLHRAP